MENLNVVNDTQQTAVESATVGCENSGESLMAPSENTKTVVADRTQSAQQNSSFRKMRIENEQYKKELQELKSKLSGLEQLETVKAQSDVYLNKLVENKMSHDLKQIQKIDPEVTDLDSIGEGFIKLIASGVDALTAYYAVKRATDGKVSPSPKSIGKVSDSGSAKSRFFTSRELDRLTARDLENPAVFKKAMESLRKL